MDALGVQSRDMPLAFTCTFLTFLTNLFKLSLRANILSLPFNCPAYYFRASFNRLFSLYISFQGGKTWFYYQAETMAVSPQPPAADDDFPRRKNKGRHLPLTPPNVSVEAIKRSLLHTPSPRRFKKLRLRRLKKKDQVTQQLPLVDPGLGEAYRGDRDDDGSCAIDLP
jgi:hypothetical protein